MNHQISKLQKFIVNNCNLNNLIISTRQRKLHFKHILYFISNLVNNNSSYSIANSQLKYKNLVDISPQALRKKRNLISNLIFSKLNKLLYEHICNSNLIKKDNIFAVDGSKITLDKSFSKKGYNLTQTKSYCKANVSCLYDVTNKLVLDCHLDDNYNERKSFVDHLSVPKNAIVLFDRGYFGYDFMFHLMETNKKFIIRMRLTKVTKLMEKRKLSQYFHIIEKNNKCLIIKIIKYTIDSKNYYLATNIFNKSIEYYKELYHLRWFVEEYFKTCKNNLNLNTIACKDINKCKQEINIQVFLSLLTRYLEIIVSKYKPSKIKELYNINHRNAIYITSRKILLYILFKNSIKKIVNCLIIIEKTKVYVVTNRHFERVRKRPVSQFYLNKKTNG
jgi:hypothetical protein